MLNHDKFYESCGCVCYLCIPKYIKTTYLTCMLLCIYFQDDHLLLERFGGMKKRERI